ncbi:hypothetical protein DERP_010106, partial [Dermatophagoides pteronyssinus]
YIRRRFRLETITPPNQRLDGHLSLTLSYSRPNHLPSSPQKSAYQMFGNDPTTFSRRSRSIPFCSVII